jgi:hypothetical protein
MCPGCNIRSSLFPTILVVFSCLSWWYHYTPCLVLAFGHTSQRLSLVWPPPPENNLIDTLAAIFGFPLCLSPYLHTTSCVLQYHIASHYYWLFPFPVTMRDHCLFYRHINFCYSIIICLTTLACALAHIWLCIYVAQTGRDAHLWMSLAIVAQ